MKKILITLCFVFICSCDAPQQAKDIVRDKHAQFYVWMERVNNPDATKRPTQDQNEQMLRAVLKDYESLDKLLNNWKENTAMKEVQLQELKDVLKKYEDIKMVKK